MRALRPSLPRPNKDDCFRLAGRVSEAKTRREHRRRVAASRGHHEHLCPAAVLGAQLLGFGNQLVECHARSIARNKLVSDVDARRDTGSNVNSRAGVAPPLADSAGVLRARLGCVTRTPRVPCCAPKTRKRVLQRFALNR
jgi:hypothetical protein